MKKENLKNVLIVGRVTKERKQAENLFNNIMKKAIKRELKKETDKLKINTYRIFTKKTSYKKHYTKEIKNINVNNTYNLLKMITYKKIDLINSKISLDNQAKIDLLYNDKNYNELSKVLYNNNFKIYNLNLQKNIYKAFKNVYSCNDNLTNKIKNIFKTKNIKLYNLLQYNDFKILDFKPLNNNLFLKDIKAIKKHFRKHKKALYIKYLKTDIKRIYENKKSNKQKLLQKSYSYKNIIDNKIVTIYNNKSNNYYIEEVETILNDGFKFILSNDKEYKQNKKDRKQLRYYLFLNSNNEIILNKTIYNILSQYIKRLLNNYFITFNNEITFETENTKDNIIIKQAIYTNKKQAFFDNKYDFLNNIKFTPKQAILLKYLSLNITKKDICNDLKISYQLLNKHIKTIQAKILKHCNKNKIPLKSFLYQ